MTSNLKIRIVLLLIFISIPFYGKAALPEPSLREAQFIDDIFIVLTKIKSSPLSRLLKVAEDNGIVTVGDFRKFFSEQPAREKLTGWISKTPTYQHWSNTYTKIYGTPEEFIYNIICYNYESDDALINVIKELLRTSLLDSTNKNSETFFQLVSQLWYEEHKSIWYIQISNIILKTSTNYYSYTRDKINNIIIQLINNTYRTTRNSISLLTKPIPFFMALLTLSARHVLTQQCLNHARVKRLQNGMIYTYNQQPPCENVEYVNLFFEGVPGDCNINNNAKFHYNK